MPVDIGEKPKPTVIVRMGEGVNTAECLLAVLGLAYMYSVYLHNPFVVCVRCCMSIRPASIYKLMG